jgi:hypothetical protein
MGKMESPDSNCGKRTKSLLALSHLKLFHSHGSAHGR